MNNNQVVGVDIGGSHITAGLVDLGAHKLIPGSLIRKRVDSRGKIEEIIHTWKSTIESVKGWDPVSCKIGIAMPGPFDYRKGISWIKDQGKYGGLYGLNIKTLLSKALHVEGEAIHFENDAACFLQGEVFAGAARGVDSAIGLTLGTGLGSAKYHGEFAEDAALWSSSFLESQIEDYVSTRWFVHAYKERTNKEISEVKELLGHQVDRNITLDIFREFSENLSVFLQEFVKNENPEIIVLGGNISKAEAFFLPLLKEKLSKSGVHIPVRITQLGEQATLIGAACSWNNTPLTLGQSHR